jgi:hypothetical protein
MDELNVDSYELDGKLWSKGRNVILFVALITWIASLFGFFTDRSQFFHSYLTSFVYFMMITLGALFFVMVQFLTGSAWSIPVRRFMESIAAGAPLGALLFVPVVLGLGDIYEWSHGSTDPVVMSKLGYLNPQFFLIRAVIYFAIWSFFSLMIYRQSTKQDRTNSIMQMHAASALSAPGLLLTFLTVTLAAFDWVMSLDPRWYSTIFGIYTFAGGGLCFMAVITLISLAFRRMGVLKSTINIEHYHDLGKWMFALTIFWAYIAFSQYLLIWYANLPEETIFFKHRFVGSWGAWSVLLLVGHFILPLLILVGRKPKRDLGVLAVMAGWTMAMHFVDVYWLIMPNFSKAGVSLHWLDFATWGAVGSSFALLFWWRMKQHALVPIGDLRFEQGLAFKNI